MCNSFIDFMHFSLNMMNDECYQFNFQLIPSYSFSIVQKPLNLSELKIFNLKIVRDVLHTFRSMNANGDYDIKTKYLFLCQGIQHRTHQMKLHLKCIQKLKLHIFMNKMLISLKMWDLKCVCLVYIEFEYDKGFGSHIAINYTFFNNIFGKSFNIKTVNTIDDYLNDMQGHFSCL